VLARLPRCQPDSPQGALTALPVGELKPTQNSVGLDEVRAKVEKIESMSSNQLADYLLQRPIPIVVGRTSEFFMIDHHHLARAMWDADKRDILIPTVVAQNWAPLDGSHFWKAMARRDWLYPFDGLGAGPSKPSSLKPNVGELENDLYRSIAWYARQRYAYVKDAANPIYAEFKWANFLRSRVVFWGTLLKWKGDPMEMTLHAISELDPSEYAEKLAFTLYLAGSPEAGGLPGFVGRR
jgi:hypothetical protein